MLQAYEIYLLGLPGMNFLGPMYPPKWIKTPSKPVSAGVMLTEVMENTPHYFIFITSPTTESVFDKLFNKHKWDRFVFHKSKNQLWNPNYTKAKGYIPRLKVIVLKGTGTDES